MPFVTTVYGKKPRQEKLCTLLEYVQMSRLEPGHKLLLVEITKDASGRECSCNAETLYVGNCTPYIQPTTSDGEEGWDYSHPRMKKFVLEIHEGQ